MKKENTPENHDFRSLFSAEELYAMATHGLGCDPATLDKTPPHKFTQEQLDTILAPLHETQLDLTDAAHNNGSGTRQVFFSWGDVFNWDADPSNVNTPVILEVSAMRESPATLEVPAPVEAARVAKSTAQPHARALRLLELFQFVLPPKVQREVYEPAFNDLLEDFLIKARTYNTNWACRWLKLCFVVRAGWMVVGSLWQMFGSVIGKCVLVLVPEQLRKYLNK